MFRIRKIHDDVSVANQQALRQVADIMRDQFPLATPEEIAKLPGQLRDPMKYRFRSLVFVAEDLRDKVKGFALFLHMPDLQFGYLEFISVAPGTTGGGLGGILYERVREEALSLGLSGVFFEVLPDEPHLLTNPELLPQNSARLRFYERYGARPILNKEFETPVTGAESNLFFLVVDTLGQDVAISRLKIRKIVRAILERKYGALCSEEYIAAVAKSFQDDPIKLREPRYGKRKAAVYEIPKNAQAKRIAIVVNEGHEIHHVRDRGYVEAPVRVANIRAELDKTGFFYNVKPRKSSDKLLKAVHDPQYVDYLRQACERVPAGKSIYPAVFPLHNPLRQPRDLDIRAGYFCMDTFTPLNKNAYLAARGAVDCAVTGAQEMLGGSYFAYALVRPPGHHAERRAFGGFCYFNSAAVAAHFLSRYGRSAILDLDFHHGNGTQDIFYDRDDVLTLSIHGHPSFAYPYFAGFADETGISAGAGFNVNYPLSEKCSVTRYQRTLERALIRIRTHQPAYLILALGLDTAKDDPTGTWTFGVADFRDNGRAVGRLGIPTLIVQEGGYRTRTLGQNARAFFEGLVAGRREYTDKMGVAVRKKTSTD